MGAIIPVNYGGLASNLTSFLSQSAGPVTFSGTTLTVPAMTAVVGGVPYAIAQQNFTVPTPSRTLATSTGGTIAYPNNPIAYTRLAFTVNNTSGGSVSGTLSMGGNDEHYPWESIAPGGGYETITVPSVANNGSVTVYSAKYYGAGSGYNSSDPSQLGAGATGNLTMAIASGTLGNSGVSITVTEYQFRGHLKITNTYNGNSPGVVSQAWDNYYQPGEMQICKYEVQASGVISIVDWRLIGPAAYRDRIGSESLDFGGFTPNGPLSGYQGVSPLWNAQCVYAVAQALDGHVFIAGNSAIICEFDGDKFGQTFHPPNSDSGTATSGTATTLVDTNKSWTVNQWAGWTVIIGSGTGAGERATIVSNTATALTVASWATATPDNTSNFTISPLDNLNDHITAMYAMGYDSEATLNEIFYIGTATGKLLQWNRTQNVYTIFGINSFGGNQIQRIFKAQGTGFSFALGLGSAELYLINNNGASAPTTSSYNTGWSSYASDNGYDGVFYDHTLFLVGGNSSGSMRLFAIDTEFVNLGMELSNYLPGTQAQRGKTSTANSVGLTAICCTAEGKLILGGSSGLGGPYFAEWDTKQEFATGEMAITVNATCTIPAGTLFTDGTNIYSTLQTATPGSSGTYYVKARSLTTGYAGMAVYNTVTTMISSISQVTGVTNTTPFGMGRYIGNTGSATNSNELPNQILSLYPPLSVVWTGSRAIFTSEGGDVVTWDGSKLRTLLKNVFKGRATFSHRDTQRNCAWLVGDEGKVMTIPGL